MSLALYREKRNFEVTPEPRPKMGKRKATDLSFVIQKHAASHLHYDFRLELNGVLLSWAVPKGPSLDPKDKRLAMHVEDHPIEYGNFEGIIPEKQYGGGTVLLWDRGQWIPREDPAAGYKKGRLKFDLVGEKLHGGWMLVRSHGAKYGEKAWLLIKEQDEFARPAETTSIVDQKPNSVVSGRSIDAIAKQRDRVWQSNKSVGENIKSGANRERKTATIRLSVAGAVKASLPAFIEPPLATLVKQVPIDSSWILEIKFDGYRMLCRVENGEARMFSRNGKDWTPKFSGLANAVATLPVQSAWLDGEIVVLGSDGRSSFQRLQNHLTLPAVRQELFYYLFDVPFLNGEDLRRAQLLDRKKALEKLLMNAPPEVRYSAHHQGDSSEFFVQACKLKLEGIIAKRADSRYSAGRGRDWLKVKCGNRQEMVIGGFTEPEGSRSGIGALLLGVYEGDGALRYSGKVGTGFNQETLDSIRAKLDAIRQEKPPFVNPPKGAEGRRARWVAPNLVAEVEFTEWTSDGTLRHPSFQGLREDKLAREVVRENPATVLDATEAIGRSSTKSARTRVAKDGSAASNVVAGVRITNPDKELYPECGITKLELARYYEAVGPWIVPQIEKRPLTLVRCPNGWQSKCFFQKHADRHVSSALERVTVQESDGSGEYMMASSVEAVVTTLQMGALELHPSGARAEDLNHPDRIVLDFDPDENLPWKDLVIAVSSMRKLLEDLGLTCFLKTTGGKGLHIVIPIAPTEPWNNVKGFSKALADLFSNNFPDRYLSTMSKAARRGKIFIDYLRNDSSATAIAAYSLRARRNAPVAMPIAWEELSKDVRGDHFNVRNAMTRLRGQRKDPWSTLTSVRQVLTEEMMDRVGFRAVRGSRKGTVGKGKARGTP